MKTPILIMFIILTTSLFAKIRVHWTGISGLYITDGKNGIMFDPVFNRPSLWRLGVDAEFTIDPKKTQFGLSQIRANKVDGIFISHTHHDHYADAPIISKKTGATIYGSKTAKFLSLSSGVEKEKAHVLKINSKYHFGDFEVEVLKAEHGKILGLFHYQDGELESKVPFPISIWNYRMGGAFAFLVTYKNKKMLIQQSTTITPGFTKKMKRQKIDIIFQGIANRRSVKALDENIWTPAQAEMIIPMHFDNFLFDAGDYKQVKYLPTIDMKGFRNYIKKTKYKMIEPTYFKELDI